MTLKKRKYKDSIYVVYIHKSRIFKIYTGVRISDAYWGTNNIRKNCPDYDNVIARIAAAESRVLTAIASVQAKGYEAIVDLVRKEYYNQLKPAKKEVSFWESYKTHLDLLTCRESTKKKVTITYNVLEYFCKYEDYDPSHETFDKVIFGKFIRYLMMNQKMADSTIHRHVKALRAFFKFSYPEKDISFMKYTLLSTDEEIVALSETELETLAAADLDGYLDKARDLFVFMATTGMRHSDSQLFDSSWIMPEKVLEFKQLKTGGKAMPPLFETTRKILEKYGGAPPQLSNQKLNDYLKKIFRQLKLTRPIKTHIVKGKQVHTEVKPLCEVITSHAARRTFISLCLQKGMPLIDVMKMSGHSDFRSMKPYIQVTRRHLRDIANMWEI